MLEKKVGNGFESKRSSRPKKGVECRKHLMARNRLGMKSLRQLPFDALAQLAEILMTGRCLEPGV